MKTVLLATDLSPRADRAAQRAMSIARAHAARLVAVHVVDEDLPADTRERISQDAKRQIENTLNRSSSPPVPGTEIRIVEGHDFRDIIRQADDCDADIIVTGIHRDYGPRRSASDTTMGKVARHCGRAVLVVSQPVDKPYEKAIVGVDLSPASRLAIRKARELLPEGKLVFVHSFEVPFGGFLDSKNNREQEEQAHTEKLREFLDVELSRTDGSAKGGNEQIIKYGNPNEVLREEVKRLQPGLLVVGIHGRGSVSRAIFGSLAESLLSNPPCDVLAASPQ